VSARHQGLALDKSAGHRQCVQAVVGDLQARDRAFDDDIDRLKQEFGTVMLGEGRSSWRHTTPCGVPPEAQRM